MGPAVVSKPDPSHPLCRRQNYVQLPEVTPFIRPHYMPPIPRTTQQLPPELKPRKNFIKENINKISHALPDDPRPYMVTDRKGNKFLIEGSGLDRHFIHKKNYGKVPLYIKARKMCINRFEECNGSSTDSMDMLPPEERICLINNLKNRYEEVFADFQRLPMILETTSAIKKKTNLTKELVDIERDIDFLEKHDHIFVVDNYFKVSDSKISPC